MINGLENGNQSRKKTSAFTLIVGFICVALVGIALIPMLPVKLNPSNILPGITVDFSMPGVSAQVVEKTVTGRLEAMLSRIKGVKSINSNSRNGGGSITIDLDKYTNTDMVRFEASTIIRQTWPELPEGVSYPSIRMKSPNEEALRPCMTFTLNSPSSPIQIQRYAEEHIKNRLAQLPGIYMIDVSGATSMEWRLEYDNDQLRQLGITISDISQAVNRFYAKEFLGTYNVESASGGEEWIRLVLTPEKEGQNSFDSTRILVQNKNGKMLRLDELVKVAYVEEKPSSHYRINGLNSIYLSITADERANQLELGKTVEKEMEDIRQNLPTGYEIHMSYNSTEYIQHELNKIYLRTSLTVIILLLFVLLITLSSKYLCLIVVSLSVNVAIAFIFYYLCELEMQMYSLAGITISLNLIIDNTIVMSDHYLRQKNRKAFVSILAATLTTMGALTVIFFMDEGTRMNLQDFAIVVIINLAVSLFVALFFVPSMIDKIGLKKKERSIKQRRWMERPHLKRIRRSTRRLPVYFTHFYQLLIQKLCHWRVAVGVVLVFAFGLPVFMIPERIEKDTKFAEIYNKTLGTTNYKDKIKPIVDRVFGGSWRLFVQKASSGNYNSLNEEPVLYVNANLPNGSTLDQMDALIKKMEVYLSEFKEIKQFHTIIYSAQRASINIYFLKEYQKSGFPYRLKSNIVTNALHLGGGSWGVYGLQDQGFSNDVRENAGSFRVKMYGYNYDELYYRAEQLKDLLLAHRRIKEVIIASNFTWWKDDYQEFYFELDKEKMAQQKISANGLFSTISPIFGQDMWIGSVISDKGTEAIKLSSKQSKIYDAWAMQNYPYEWDERQYKLSDVARIAKGLSPQEIAKENQQYRLCLQYEYIGTAELGYKLLDRELEKFNKTLPIGYKAESEKSGGGWWFGGGMNQQFKLLLIIVSIIFFITSILFNSLKQPLAIIFVIPVSYIGVFLTFYWFGLNFDQGGFASLVLLCGITVNASIYILNEYNSIRKRFPNLSPLRAYTKAWNTKIIPIFLTVVSTILGFIPFMVGEGREAFWFPLAAGTIGGLVMSVIGVFIWLPVLALKRKLAIPS